MQESLSNSLMRGSDNGIIVRTKSQSGSPGAINSRFPILDLRKNLYNYFNMNMITGQRYIYILYFLILQWGLFCLVQ